MALDHYAVGVLEACGQGGAYVWSMRWNGAVGGQRRWWKRKCGVAGSSMGITYAAPCMKKACRLITSRVISLVSDVESASFDRSVMSPMS